jgi:Esterase-like activity of phytase
VRLVWLVALVAACGQREVDRERAAKLFTEVKLDTAPGLSGLATDDTGGIWTIAERDRKAYRITLDAQDKPTLEPLSVEGVSPSLDLEGIAWLGAGKFALGTEGKTDGIATVLLAERRGETLAVTKSIELPAARLGVALPANHGAEGVCGVGNTILVAIEATGTVGGKRFAPIVRIENDAIVRVHRMWLMTDVGKLSALDCTIAADGTAEVLAIERHFKVTKILRFTLPPTDGDITPIEALDLGPVLKSRLNLEGIAVANGRVFAVVDNQWKTLQGPSVLVVFRPDAVKLR